MISEGGLYALTLLCRRIILSGSLWHAAYMRPLAIFRKVYKSKYLACSR